MIALRNTLLAVFFLLLPGMAFANCTDLLDPDNAAVQRAPVAPVQLGLRTALNDANPLLDDGQMGAYTLAGLDRLCQFISRDGEASVASTLKLAETYGELALVTGTGSRWRENLLSSDFKATLSDPLTPQQQALPIRLAATPLMKAKVLGDQTAPFSCLQAVAATAESASAQAVMRQLYSSFDVVSPIELCRVLPMAGGATDFVDALEALGALERDFPGALGNLTDPEFGPWLAAQNAPTLIGMAGSPASVRDVIKRFRNRSPSVTQVASPNPCALNIAETSTTYFELTEEDIANIETSLDLEPLLMAFAEEHAELGSVERLWAELEQTLSGTLDDCILPTVRSVVLDTQNLGLSFELNAEETTNLVAEPELQDAKEVIEEFLDAAFPSEERLIAAIQTALSAQTLAEAELEIEKAADLLAAAAEPVAPLNDTPALSEEIPQPDAPPPPTTGVTDATALSLEQSLKNRSFIEALLAENFLPATKPELLKGQVRSTLRPIAEVQSAQKVAKELEMIVPAAKGGWSLTPKLRRAILAIPYIAEAKADATGGKLTERMKEVAGVQYPSLRLFQAALDTVPPADLQPVDRPLSDYLLNKIVNVALTEAPRSAAPRLTEGFAKEKCGCVPATNKQTEVYSFYPFWFAPVAPTVESAAALEETDAAEPMPHRIDFSLTGRVAYYGLEFDFVDPDAPAGQRDVILKHEDQWTAAKRSFVNEAHRHRGKVDVAFDLRNWQHWSIRNIEQAIAKISVQMAPFDKVPSYRLKDFAAALPTIFDTPQPDGLTLIFHGYEPNKMTPAEMDQMINIIKEVHAALPNRERLDINVAFDFARVADDLETGLFDELYDLLITRTIIVQEQARDNRGIPIPAKSVETERDTLKMISRILFFLERKTSDNKKGLRFRMEQGLFQGDERSNVLHSIIPVLPPGGHKNVQPTVKPKRLAAQRDTFGQFEDDAIYFRDNFAGIGFWPLPLVDGPETAELAKIIHGLFDQNRLPELFGSFETAFRDLCTVACPQRAYLSLIGMGLFAAMAVLTWRSYYSGNAEKLAFRVLMVGTVRLINLTLFLLLLVLTFCDSDAKVAPVLLGAFTLLVLVVWIGRLLNRARNGPMP